MIFLINAPIALVAAVGFAAFFMPLTALSLGSVEEHETASAAGLQNFVRTLSGAVATSVVTTAWEDRTTIAHAELAGVVDRGGEVANQILGSVAFVFALGAAVIRLAPRPSRSGSDAGGALRRQPFRQFCG